MIFMNACKLVTGNYKGLYYACIIQTYGCPLLHRPFLAIDLDAEQGGKSDNSTSPDTESSHVNSQLTARVCAWVHNSHLEHF